MANFTQISSGNYALTNLDVVLDELHPNGTLLHVNEEGNIKGLDANKCINRIIKNPNRKAYVTGVPTEVIDNRDTSDLDQNDVPSEEIFDPEIFLDKIPGRLNIGSLLFGGLGRLGLNEDGNGLKCIGDIIHYSISGGGYYNKRDYNIDLIKVDKLPEKIKSSIEGSNNYVLLKDLGIKLYEIVDDVNKYGDSNVFMYISESYENNNEVHRYTIKINGTLVDKFGNIYISDLNSYISSGPWFGKMTWTDEYPLLKNICKVATQASDSEEITIVFGRTVRVIPEWVLYWMTSYNNWTIEFEENSIMEAITSFGYSFYDEIPIRIPDSVISFGTNPALFTGNNIEYYGPLLSKCHINNYWQAYIFNGYYTGSIVDITLDLTLNNTIDNVTVLYYNSSEAPDGNSYICKSVNLGDYLYVDNDGLLINDIVNTKSSMYWYNNETLKSLTSNNRLFTYCASNGVLRIHPLINYDEMGVCLRVREIRGSFTYISNEYTLNSLVVPATVEVNSANDCGTIIYEENSELI